MEDARIRFHYPKQLEHRQRERRALERFPLTVIPLNRIARLCCVICALGGSVPARGADPKFEVWPVDPLTKVFRDAEAAEGEALAEVARGEHATFQIVARSAEPAARLRCQIKPPAAVGPGQRSLGGARVRWVGYVPVDIGIPNPPGDQLRKPPADFPDPLLEVSEVDLKAGQAQPVWITLKVPLDAKPGLYVGEAKVYAAMGRSQVARTIPLAVRVYDAQVDKSRLWVTNWFHLQRWPGVEPFPKKDTPQHWEVLRRYARNMADHRQNVVRVAPLQLVDHAGSGSRMRFDFRRFDRWVKTFLDEGFGLIEGQQFGWRAGDWNGPFVVSTYVVKDDKTTEVRVDPTSPEAEQFYAQFLPALHGHLRERGWLDRYVQHVADEPTDANAESYRAIANLVRKYAKGMRTLDAVFTTKLDGAVDVWVPHLDTFHKNLAHYQERKRRGDEVWFYTCVAAQGEYANRFFEQPLLKTRLLHWINYKYGATGYLHWGYNYWTADPFTDPVDVREGNFVLPAGESWIVYPGKDGTVIDSIRFEAMRDGIADYELFCQLAERDDSAAQRLAGTHVLDFDKYDCDVNTFRATRREMLKLLSATAFEKP